MFPRVAMRTAAAAVAVAAVVTAGSASYSASYPSPGGVTVTAGDTLWAIAAAHSVTVDQLAAANGMSTSDLLLIGRHLSIPTGSPSVTSAVVAGPATSGKGATVRATSAPAATNTNFCATASFYQGPYGELPSYLTGTPHRLALRPLMVRWAQNYGVAPALVEAVAWQESGWQQGVVSPDGAIGIGQILPATGTFVDDYLVGANLNIHSASDNIRMESAFLAYLIRQVGNNPCLVAAAYYQGPAALAADGVYAESQQYVRDVLALETEFS